MKSVRMTTTLLKDQKFILFCILIGINVIFSILSPTFFQLENYYNMFKQSAMIIITASGATLLMMTGNFDLSTGSNLAFAGMLYTLLSTHGIPMFLSGIAALLCGVGFGMINGVLIIKYNLPPFIATLGVMYVGRGLTLIACDGRSLRENIPENFNYLASGDIFGIPLAIIYIIVFVLIFWFLQKKSLLGKYSLAIGGNRNAAFFSGINADAIIFWLYVIVGILAAFSGIMTASRIGAGDPRSGELFFFDVIVAILLGGTSLKGGKGAVIGTLIGALVVTVLGNGLDMLNVLPFWQQVLKGVILVLAVAMNEKLARR
jgi:ribose/xylose/arabinose/galactoside ABC-type transport system permease subunit